jgi:hypothetical protein
MCELADSLGTISPLFETAMALEEACEDSLGPKAIYPNVVYGLLLVLQALRSMAMRYDYSRISGL